MCAARTNRKVSSGESRVVLADLHWLEILQRILRFLERVQRQRRIVFRLLHLVVEARVFFLQMARIRKDDATQIDRRRRGENSPAESFLHQSRNPSAVIEVRMGQDDRVDRSGRNRRVVPVTLTPFFRPLKKPAVDQYLVTALAGRISGVDQVLRASNGSRRSKKLDVGQTFLPQ